MLKQYYRINEAIGIGITLLQDGKYSIDVCSILIKNSKLDIEKKFADIKDFNELIKRLDSKIPVAINLTGKGVLQKKVNKLADIDHANFSSVLPNGNLDDYYVQNFISGENSFISIIRRLEAEKYIQQLIDIGFTPVMLSLGPFPVANIASQLNIYGTELVFAGHKIDRNDQGDWISYNFDKTFTALSPLKLESEIISEKLIIPYAIAFQLVLHDKLNVIETEVPSLRILLNETIDNKKLKANAITILLFFFIALLINFVIFSLLNSENRQLAGQISLSSINTSNTEIQTQHIKLQETFLKNFGWDGGISKTEVIEQLASILPETVNWTSFEINPVNSKKNTENRHLIFEDRKIRIMGNTTRIVSLNEWIANAKSKKWIKTIQIENYNFNNDTNTGQFSLIINY